MKKYFLWLLCTMPIAFYAMVPDSGIVRQNELLQVKGDLATTRITASKAALALLGEDRDPCWHDTFSQLDKEYQWVSPDEKYCVMLEEHASSRKLLSNRVKTALVVYCIASQERLKKFSYGYRTFFQGGLYEAWGWGPEDTFGITSRDGFKQKNFEIAIYDLKTLQRNSNPARKLRSIAQFDRVIPANISGFIEE